MRHCELFRLNCRGAIRVRNRFSRSTVLLLLFCVGCHGADDLDSPTARRLQSLAKIYGDYAAASGKGPLNVAQLSAHAMNLEPVIAEALAPDDEIIGNFISDRDGHPFVIRFGIPASDFSPGSRVPIAYEQSGKNGQRLVTNLHGVVECLDEKSFNERGVSRETPSAL